MESIESAARVAQPSMTQGPAPKHTVDGHRGCVYYPNLSLNTMSCPHGEYATGAFYSEDHVKRLVGTINRLDTIDERPEDVANLQEWVK